MADLKVAVLTCSDTRGEAEDTAGQALSQLIAERGWSVDAYQVCPDECGTIQAAIVAMAEGGADIVLTCGGTGLGPRDVTPEATFEVADRVVPGIAEHIRAESLKLTGRAMLSRGTAATRGRTLVVNLPGSEKAARQCFGFVADQFEHAVDMMRGGGH
jgi:molybdopterin adenylyltransferase